MTKKSAQGGWSGSDVSFTPPQKITIVQSIIKQILEQIQEQRLKPGDILPSERELISVLGVSRSSVREALQGLIAMNVLESRPGQGTFVKAKPASPAWAADGGEVTAALWKKTRLDLIAARLIIDEAVALTAAERCQQEDLDQIANRLAAYKNAMAQPDRDRLLEEHKAFHMAIAESTGNYFLIRMSELLLEDALPASMRYPEYRFESENFERATVMLAHEAHDHQALYDAIAARDSQRIRAAIHQNMQLAREIIEQESEVLEKQEQLALAANP